MGVPPTKTKVEEYKISYRDPRREHKKTVAKSTAEVTSIGLTNDLKGRIYDVGTRSQANQFTPTAKALAVYAGHKCNNSQDIRISIKRQKEVITPILSMITDIDKDVSKLLIGK